VPRWLKVVGAIFNMKVLASYVMKLGSGLPSLRLTMCTIGQSASVARTVYS